MSLLSHHQEPTNQIMKHIHEHGWFTTSKDTSKEIRQALRFLESYDYIVEDNRGKYVLTKKGLALSVLENPFLGIMRDLKDERELERLERENLVLSIKQHKWDMGWGFIGGLGAILIVELIKMLFK